MSNDFKYTLLGSPWRNINSSVSIDARDFKYTLLGSPWWGMGGGAQMAGHIKRACGIGRENIKKIGGVNIGNVKMAGGLVD